jgi:tRNA(fMet)-specific endonuclease VapC
LSLLEWGGPEAMRLRERLLECAEKQVVVTIISYEEQIRGWMAYIARARKIQDQLVAYQRLRQHLENYRSTIVVDFDEQAAIRYQELRESRVRLGSMDLKIASIALSLDAMLLSRNLIDFQKVPKLRVEDWTR